MENHYVTRLQSIRRQGGTVQVYANVPLPLAAALHLEPGEKVTWKVLDRTHLLLLRPPGSGSMDLSGSGGSFGSQGAAGAAL
jgi:hypothetical protein